MNLCKKIAFTMVILMIVPLVITVISDKIYSDKICTNACINYNNSITASASSVFSYMFENVIADGKTYSSDNAVKNYTEMCRSGFALGRLDSEAYEAVYNSMMQYNRKAGLLDCFLVNAENIIIFSSTEDMAGNAWRETAEFDEATGISSMFMYGNDSKKPAFMSKRRVFSSKNVYVGTLYAVYSTDTLRKAIKCIDTKDYSELAFADFCGNVFYDNHIVSSNSKDANEFEEFSDRLTSYVSGELTELSTIKYTYLKAHKYASFSKTELGGWIIIGMTDYDGLKWYYDQPKLPTIISGVIVAVLMVILVSHFTAPVKQINEFLKQKSKGDISARLEIYSNDDFQEIGQRFSSVFDELMDSELRYRTIVEMLDSIAFDVDFRTRTVHVSNSFDKKFSFRPKNTSIIESFLYKWYVHKDDKMKYSSDVKNIMNSNDEFWQGEYRVKNIYGGFSWVLIKARKLYDSQNNPYRMVGVISDIDREKENELHLIRKASYDQLTQIYNRESFMKLLSAEMDNYRSSHELSAVLFIDLDDFKHFNDNYGHSCGDEVLKFTADAIKEITFEHGFGGRFGGDEFIVCLTDLKLIGDAGNAASELIRILSEGFLYGEQTVFVKCSIGIAFFGENGKNCDEIIAAADAAMYRIKKHGKSDFAYASADEESAEPRVIGKPIDSDLVTKSEDTSTKNDDKTQ